MYVPYVLFVITCAVPVFLHVTAQEHCRFKGLSNQFAYCKPSDADRTFDYVPRIEHRIEYITLGDQPLKQLVRNAFANITTQNQLGTINLDHCQIQHVDVDAFEHLDSLEYLNLSDNGISRLEPGTFQHTKRLLRIFLRFNSIETLHSGVFHNLVSLREVSLHHNNITGIDIDTFRNTPALTQISLQFNKLEYLSPLFTDNFRKISNLVVEGNPWNCDCNLRELYEKDKVRKSQYGEPKLVCQNPPGLRGVKFSNIASAWLRCDARIICPTNDTKVVRLGANVTLSCAVSAVPVPDIEWHRRSTVIAKYDVYTNREKDMHYLNYTFTVHEQDLGEYSCSAYNTDVKDMASTTLTVADARE